MKTFPIKALTAAVAKALILPLHGFLAPWTDRKAGQAGCIAITAYLRNAQGLPVDKFLLHGTRKKQIIRRAVKAIAEFFQCVNRRCRLPPGNRPEVSGTERASFTGSLIAEMVEITQVENIRGEIVRKHL